MSPHSLEGRVHPAAVAAGVAVGPGAVNQLLFAEGDQGVSSQSPGALQGAGGREGPARAALSLVLDVGHNSSIAPVLGGSGHLARVLAGIRDWSGLRAVRDRAYA